jgi:Protein of unknown function (DUF2783)
MLITTPNLETPDASYAALIAAHDGMTEAESHAMNARLVLILMNHIGTAGIIAQALACARNPKQGD